MDDKEILPQDDTEEPAPIYETIEEEPAETKEATKEPTVEESAPEDLTPEELQGGEPPNAPSEDAPYESSGNWKKYLIVGGVILVFLVIFTLVLGFARKKTSKSQVKLIYWGLWEEKTALAPLITKYTRKNPGISIEYSKQAPKNYRQKVVARSKEGRGPDIFRFHNTWVPMLSEILAPIPKSIMTKDEFTKIFYKVAYEDLKLGNSIIGIPLEIDALVLIYNDDSFRRAGISVPPNTWEDIISYSQQLTVPDIDGNIVTSGISLGTADNIEHFSDIIAWMLLQNGADLANFESNEAEDVLKRYREFAEPPLAVWNNSMPNNIAAFAQGKVAMIIVPSWQIISIKTMNPDLNFKVTHLPLLPGEEKPFSLASYWVEGVSRASKNQEEAWKFISFLVERENLTALYKEQAESRLFGEPYSRVDLAETIVQNEYIGPVIEQAQYLQSLPAISRTFDDGLNDEINTYLRNAVNDTIKGVSYSEAAKRGAEGINQVYEKYKVQ